MLKAKNTLILMAVICVIAGGIFYYNSHANDKEEYSPTARPVKTISAEKSKHTVTRSFPGKVRASQRVNLSFEVGGLLTDLPVRDGLVVKKGDLIARLDQRTFINNVNSAQAAFTEAKLHFERQEKLLKEKIVAQSVMDSSKSAYDRAKAQLEIAKKALSDTELLAPFDGIITNKYVNNHQKVSPTQNIVSLQDMSNIEIVIQVPETIMVYASPKDYKHKLLVKFDAIENKEFEANIHEYSVDADNQTQTYEVVLIMPTSDEFNFLPGMTATVTSSDIITPAEEVRDIIWVPASAVLGEESGNKSFVYIINSNNTAEKRYVEIGAPTEAGIPVLSGLNTGERVIIAGSSYIRNGMAVRAM